MDNFISCNTNRYLYDTFYKYLDIPELFNLAAEAKTNVKVYKSSAFWLDIGRRDQYNRAVEMFS